MSRLHDILLNERSFDRLFCDVSSSDRFDIYYNTNFADDPIFNHIVIADSVMAEGLDGDSISLLLYKIKSEASSKNISPTVFVEKNWKFTSKLEERAIEGEFRILGMMEILSKKVALESRAVSTGRITVFETRDYNLWNETFMRSFSLGSEWKEELLRREELFSNNTSTTLLLAMETNSTEPSGCTLLHRTPSNVLGIYCVGTVPERRGRGVANSMLRTAEQFASSLECKLLTLQTVSSDGVTPMYLKYGFIIDSGRDLLQLNTGSREK
ncbi:MAG: GNAT family N-acetyltransferase [Nitrososphaerota archaeon]|nr:GNAT family N-acetyltransferase [Nitrososphaerota archaeon]